MPWNQSLIEECAQLAHEMSRAYCRALDDDTQVPWDDAPEWQKESVRAGVVEKLDNPDMTPEQTHEKWVAYKGAEGWSYGPKKDPDRKEHPCLVTYEELPPEQKAKDYLFVAAVEQGCRIWRERQR